MKTFTIKVCGGQTKNTESGLKIVPQPTERPEQSIASQAKITTARVSAKTKGGGRGMAKFFYLFATLISANAYGETYQDVDKQRRTCERMGEAAAIGYNYQLEHGQLEAILYVSEKVVSMRKKKAAELAEDEAQIYEAFSKGLKYGTRSAKDAYMAGWSWCMDGMQMK